MLFVYLEAPLLLTARHISHNSDRKDRKNIKLKILEDRKVAHDFVECKNLKHLILFLNDITIIHARKEK